MAIEEKEVNVEEQQQEQKSLDEKGKKVTDDIFKSLNLPADDKPVEKPDEEEPREIPIKKVETEEEDLEESTEDSGEEEEEVEESDEDLIPKSKVQKRFDQLTRRIKELEAKTEKAEVREEPDDLSRKLESLSVDQLKDLKKQVRVELIKAQQSGDEARLLQLSDLEDKVMESIQESPKRFETKQISKFNEAVKETMDDDEIPGFSKNQSAQQDVFNIAKDIYSKSSSMQRSAYGQAEAWRLAVEHYKKIGKSSAGKEKVSRLVRENNTLKKKTTLDAGALRGNEQKTKLSQLKQKAIHGDAYDKENFVKEAFNIDQFIPDDLK